MAEVILGRISSGLTRGESVAPIFLDLVLPFFTVQALSARSSAGADDANGALSFCKHNCNKTRPFGKRDENFSLLIRGMAWVRNHEAERITERGSSLVE